MCETNQATVRIQGSGDNRRTSDAGSCAHVGEHTTEVERFPIHGVLKGKEFAETFR